jgi:hypothetical protein
MTTVMCANQHNQKCQNPFDTINTIKIGLCHNDSNGMVFTFNTPEVESDVLVDWEMDGETERLAEAAQDRMNKLA